MSLGCLLFTAKNTMIPATNSTMSTQLWNHTFAHISCQFCITFLLLIFRDTFLFHNLIFTLGYIYRTIKMK